MSIADRGLRPGAGEGDETEGEAMNEQRQATETVGRRCPKCAQLETTPGGAVVIGWYNVTPGADELGDDELLDLARRIDQAVAAAVAAEREECAKLCDDCYQYECCHGGDRAADAIRARREAGAGTGGGR